jgi:hypothetical protein
VSPSRDRARLEALLSAGLNWDGLLLLGEEHGVQGMLARCLQEIGYARVPGDARQKMQSGIRAQQLLTLGLTAELFRVLGDFAKAGIEAIPVKGPLLSQLAYDDPAMRSFGDVDLLLPQRFIPPAIERMLAMGFAPDLPLGALRSGKVPGEYVFRRAGRLVELHTERTFRHYPRPMRIEEMIGRKRQVSLDGRPVPELCLEDELVFHCIHGSKDFWERLIWVSDVAALLTKYPEIDWKKACRAAEDVGAKRMLHVGVQLASTVLGVHLPGPISKEIQGDARSRSLSEEIRESLPYAGHRPQGLVKRARYRAQMSGGGVPGLSYLLRLSLVPSQDDWDQSGGERKGWFWEVVRRPLRLIRKYGSDV